MNYFFIFLSQIHTLSIKTSNISNKFHDIEISKGYFDVMLKLSGKKMEKRKKNQELYLNQLFYFF